VIGAVLGKTEECTWGNSWQLLPTEKRRSGLSNGWGERQLRVVPVVLHGGRAWTGAGCRGGDALHVGNGTQQCARGGRRGRARQ
jgi:hypothetical protein